jgi:hypothetical protein
LGNGLAASGLPIRQLWRSEQRTTLLRIGWIGGHVTPEWELRSNRRLLRGNLLKRRLIDKTVYVGVTLEVSARC